MLKHVYTHTRTRSHENFKIYNDFHIIYLHESSYTFIVIYFRAQKITSELDVLVVYLLRTSVIFITSSLHVFEARNRSIIFRIL